MAIIASPRSRTTPRKARQEASAPATVWGSIREALASPLADYYLILVAVGLLALFGITMVTSASSVYGYVQNTDAFYFAKRQVVFMVLGSAVCWFLSRRSFAFLRPLGVLAMLASTGLLILTLLIGTTTNGNRSWLNTHIAGFAFQPSEFAKFAMILWGADVLAKRGKALVEPAKILFPFAVWSGILILLVVMQHDMGTAIVMTGIVMAMLFFVGTPLRILGGIALGAAGGALALIATSGNRLARITGFVDGGDAQGINAQSTQSVYGLAAGGWTGRGLSKSRQKYGYLPEAHTDFIFAILGEELGLLGALAVVGLFCLLGVIGLRCALKSDTIFGRMAAAGCTVWLLFQGIINLFVVLNLLPVTGVPLPFLSYGGSAVMCDFLAIGLLLACARHEPEARAWLARKGRGPARRLTAIVDGGRA